jgi:ABC-2 type transport system permease protein
VTSLTATQVGALARRSISRTIRQPASVGPAILFPLLLLAVNSGGLRAVTNLPGFPTSSYLDFFIAFSFMQGALFATLNSGTDLAREIQTGFLKRLSLTPLRRSALLIGHLSGALFMGLIQAVVYLTVGLSFGVRLQAGGPGVLVLLLLSALITLAFASLGTFFALRTGSGESVQGLFPLFFVALFLSSMYLPRNLIETDWFRWIANYNPASYMIEAIRSLVITGWNAEALALGFGLSALIAIAGLTLSSLALRTRLGHA